MNFPTSTPDAQLPLLPAPEIDPNMAGVIDYLFNRPGWHHAAEIAAWLTKYAGENQLRYVRKLASQASPEIISGQAGYKHIEHASTEVIHHFINAMRSQSAEMEARALAVAKRAHELIGG